MKRYLALLRFTERGAQKLDDSARRAAAFRKTAEKEGVQIEAQYWAIGKYDGILILSAPDETTALRQLAKLAKAGNVRTHTLELLDAEQFGAVTQD